MKVRLLRAATHRFDEIWRYTADRWSPDQADAYVSDLLRCIEAAAEQRFLWKTIPDPDLVGLFFVRCQQHRVYFKQLKNGDLGIVTVLHAQMDLPERLREDSRLTDEEEP